MLSATLLIRFPLLWLIFLTAPVVAFSQVDPPPAYSGTMPVNYIRTWDLKKPETNTNNITVNTPLQTAMMTTAYFDGLGRKVQSAVKQGSLVTGQSAADLVATVVYDEFGREIYHYLPFAANSTGGNTSVSDGLFKLDPFQQQATFNSAQFPGETYYYGKTNYETSPLNRVTSVYSAGNSWAGSEQAPNANDRHGTGIDYGSNGVNDAVRIWQVDPSTGLTSSSTAYAPGELFRTVSTDEHKKKIIEYKDKQGLTILRKVQIDESPAEDHTGWLCSYYVYDALNNVRMVIPPKATKELAASSWNLTSTIINGLCFRYEYDERNRPIIKKTPGAAETWMIYDARDRLVLVQDGNLRVSHKWLFTKYDQLNRPILTGFYSNATYLSQATMQSYLTAQAMGFSEGDAPSGFPYTLDQSFPVITNTEDIETVTFYDDYRWVSWYGLSADRNPDYDGYFLSPSNSVYPYPEAVVQSQQVKGRVTGRWVRPHAITASYYDAKGREIQTRTYNHTGQWDINSTQYSWTGQPLVTISKTVKGGSNPQTTVVVTQTTYDDLGRVLQVDKRLSNTLINGNAMSAFKTVVKNEYAALGQLQRKILGSDIELLDYDYNIRGWLTGINRAFVNNNANRYFGFELGYDKTGTVISGASFAAAQYTGNISGMLWKSKGDGQRRKYDFSYDAANRLLKADFNQYSSGSFSKGDGIDFSVKMGDGTSHTLAYDANGNILRMQQWGLKGFTSSPIDDLTYTYEPFSNRLKNVIDDHNDPQTTLGDFRSSQAYLTALGSAKTIAAVDYSYDDNGNLTKDLNKDIDDASAQPIEYNHLNLPVKIRIKNKGTIEFLYDALGNKLQKTVKETGQPDIVALYLNGLVFENDQLQFVLHDEGRIRPVGTTGFAYDYFLKDHLGSIRGVLTDQTATPAGYQATMETAHFTTEDALFTRIGETVADKPGGFDRDGANEKVSKLFNASGNDKRVGPGLLLKVMAGDQFKAGVKGWYQPSGTNADPLPGASSIVTSLISAFTGGMSGIAGHGSSGIVPGSTELTGPLQAFVTGNNNSAGSGVPKAYLNWIVLDDEQFKLVEGNYGAIPMPAISGSMEKQPLVANGGNNIEVLKNGYLYVYVSNESQGNVYFDELSVTHTRGALLEESHYYPFGLTMKGISGKALAFGDPENKNKFTSQELDAELGLNWYQLRFRNHDPQIGRFIQVDPLASKYVHNSTYAYAENDVIRSIDVEGLEKYIVTYWYDHNRVSRVTTAGIRARDSKQYVDMNFKTGSKDLTTQNVYVRHLNTDGTQYANAQTRKNLLTTEAAQARQAPLEKEPAGNAIYYDLGDQKGGAKTKSQEFQSEEFAYARSSRDVAPTQFQGVTMQPGQSYNFGSLTVSLDQTTPPQVGVDEAKTFAKALQNSGISSISIQPSMVDVSGGAAANTVMPNGNTQMQNVNANWQSFAKTIQDMTGIQVTVLPVLIRNTTLTATSTNMNVKTQ